MLQKFLVSSFLYEPPHILVSILTSIVAIAFGVAFRAIARAIVNRPVLLLADEPTGALDSHTTKEILHIFTQLNASGMTVVMVTHEPEVARCTRRVIWFKDGEVVHFELAPENLSHLIRD